MSAQRTKGRHRIRDRVPRARRAREPADGAGPPSFTGTAKLGRRTKHLVKRLGPGDIAIIDHEGIDRV